MYAASSVLTIKTKSVFTVKTAKSDLDLSSRRYSRIMLMVMSSHKGYSIQNGNISLYRIITCHVSHCDDLLNCVESYGPDITLL